MPWIVGIDEAGYGPNLGPLVMTSVACQVPEGLGESDLWQLLRGAARRASEPADDRPLVADSKLVYSPDRGLGELETAILSVLLPEFVQSNSLSCLIDRLCPDSHTSLRSEPWYVGTTVLPIEADATRCRSASERMIQACEQAGLSWGIIRSVLVCPPQFNALLDRWDSKAAVLGHGLATLLDCNHSLDAAAGTVHYFIDKHGGRNHYSAMLQDALPDGLVTAVAESKDRSVYQVLGLGRKMRLTFQPRADAEHFCVALASMVSKYLRELLMGEFNAFWNKHVPGLKPTAGYPSDAGRFLEAIRPALRKLGIDEAVLWRRK